METKKKQSTENPVYYIQYAHARICSVLKEVENREIRWNPEDGFNEEVLSSSEEKKLAATLSSFADVAEKAAVEMAPHVIANFALDLAGDFHSFYNSGRIIGESEDVMRARLFLAKATGSVLATILGILGISAPERM